MTDTTTPPLLWPATWPTSQEAWCHYPVPTTYQDLLTAGELISRAGLGDVVDFDQLLQVVIVSESTMTAAANQLIRLAQWKVA